MTIMPTAGTAASETAVDHELEGVRAAGVLLAAAGVAFLAVVTYLFAVLLPMGLRFALFDDAAGLLEWLRGHDTAYLAMYGLYLVQQLLLLAVPVLLWRYGRAVFGRQGPVAPLSAATAGLVSVPIAMLSIVELVMSTHTATLYWSLGSADPVRRASILLTFDAAADLAKGARLLSEILLGLWLLWLGAALARPAPVQPAGAVPRARLGWWLVSVVGVWTVIVGVWKLLDPAMEPEDWVAFLIGGAQLAAGIGLVRRSRGVARG